MKKLLLLVFVVALALLVSCESDYDRILKSNHIEIRSEVDTWLSWEIHCPDGSVLVPDDPFAPLNLALRTELNKEYTLKFTSYDLAYKEVISHCETTVKTDTRRTYVIVKENETDQLFCKVMHLD